MGENLIWDFGEMVVFQPYISADRLIGGNSKIGPDDNKSMVKESIHGKFQFSAMLGVCCRVGFIIF